MRLSVKHQTHYNFKDSLNYGLQQLRLTPKTNSGQNCINWELSISGGDIQAEFLDHHNNHVHLVALHPDTKHVEITSKGLLDIESNHGIIGDHKGFAPLWYFQTQTDLTKAGKQVMALLKGLSHPLNHTPQSFHNLSETIASSVHYETGTTNSSTNAEQAVSLGKGVCQDHAHIFISIARQAGFSARYISGYLMMNDRVMQEATHAWAEVYLDNLGWVGFDVSNGISPDERYIRLASGLDYQDVAPISGMTYGGAGESLSVNIQVQQQ